MKLLIFLIAASAAFAHIDILSQNFIDEINSKQSHWIAGKNFPENTTTAHLLRLNGFLGLHPDPNYKPRVKRHQIFSQIPEFFDARQKWSFCESLSKIRDQGACGSCWAFAAVETMSDRTCIHSSGSVKFTFSPEDVLSCCSTCGNCVGGFTMEAFNFWMNQGTVSGGDANSYEGCKPYSINAHDYGQTPGCIQSCNNGYYQDYYADKLFGRESYVVYGMEQIQNEILNNGPMVLHFEVFQDFYNYQSGVYYHVSGVSVGYHAVKVIGWGTENGLPYWLIANSWGYNWGGDGGFFKILRGRNECGIEDSPAAALPRL